MVSSHGPTSATREHEKRILESILPPDLRHLVRGGSQATIQVLEILNSGQGLKYLDTAITAHG